MYRIDEYGLVTNHSDIGFVSIGSGGIHSSAHFMLLPYNHVITYFPSLYHTFKAKKRAEADPFVGEQTDMFVVTRDGVSPVDKRVIDALEALHKEDIEKLQARPTEAEKKLSEQITDLFGSQPISPPDSTNTDRSSSGDSGE
jgi:hypothetical protein